MAYKTPNQIIAEAVKDLTENGFTPARVQKWVALLRISIPAYLRTGAFQKILKSRYDRATQLKTMRKIAPSVPTYRLEQIRPDLRKELEYRIAASADLIKLNKEAAVQKTLQRFSGWASSVPIDGTRVADKNEIKAHINKPLKQLDYEERRLANDQGLKLVSNINEIIAKQTRAIAAQWYSNWPQANYDYRIDHKERDGKIYAIRGNWAIEKGLMKVGENGYTDQITKPAEEINCRCRYTYITSLRDLPSDMLTTKGREALKEYAID